MRERVRLPGLRRLRERSAVRVETFDIRCVIPIDYQVEVMFEIADGVI